MMHLLEQHMRSRISPCKVEKEESEDGIVAYSFTDKGSRIQLVFDELIRMADPGGWMLTARWKQLERQHDIRATWFVRDCWLQRPIIVAWRCSLAASFVVLGLRYAIGALRGEES